MESVSDRKVQQILFGDDLKKKKKNPLQIQLAEWLSTGDGLCQTHFKKNWWLGTDWPASSLGLQN